MGDERRYADVALALEQELQKERFRREVAEKTADMLKDELLKSAEKIIELQAEPEGRRKWKSSSRFGNWWRRMWRWWRG